MGRARARLNDIAPGIIVTPLAIDEFNGPCGDFYKNIFKEIHPLEHEAEILYQGIEAVFPHIPAVQRDIAGLYFSETGFE